VHTDKSEVMVLFNELEIKYTVTETSVEYETPGKEKLIATYDGETLVRIENLTTGEVRTCEPWFTDRIREK
jgi:hypothetical protein